MIPVLIAVVVGMVVALVFAVRRIIRRPTWTTAVASDSGLTATEQLAELRAVTDDMLKRVQTAGQSTDRIETKLKGEG